MNLPYTYQAGYMSDRDNAPIDDINKLITGALFEEVFLGFRDNDAALILKTDGVWTGTLSSVDGDLSLTNGSITLATGDVALTAGDITLADGDITLTNGSLSAKIDGGTF